MIPKIQFEPTLQVSNTSTFKHINPIMPKCNSNAKTSGSERMIPLPSGFSPGPLDVICSRGKEAKTHLGNEKFLSVVESYTKEYSQATSRVRKSILVSRIVDQVRDQSPNGGFVKEEGGRWYEVGDLLAREKVGQSFRNLLHGQYKSSNKSKMRRRRRAETKMREDLGAVLQANEVASRRMEELSHSLQTENAKSDEDVTRLLTQMNTDLLQSFKKDEAVQQLIREQACTESTQADDGEPKLKEDKATIKDSK